MSRIEKQKAFDVRAERSQRGWPFGAALAVFLMASLAARILEGWICRIGWRWSWDYGPALMALAAHRLLQGGHLYIDFIKHPLAGSELLYNPLSLYLAAALSPPFGKGPFAALAAGRVLTICATIGVCLLIFLLARRMGAGRSAALIAALAFALSPLLEPWGFEFRPDMPALAAEMLGLYLFKCGFAGAAIALLIAGFLFKQSCIAGIGAIALYTWLNGDRMRAIKLGFSWLVAVVIATAMLAVLFPNYWLNTFRAITSEMDFLAAAGFFSHTLFFEFTIFGLAAVGLVRKGPKHSLAVCFLIAALAQDAAGSVRWGSNIYYFLPTLAAATIVAAPELTILLEKTRRLAIPWQVLAGGTIAGLVVFQLGLGVHYGGPYGISQVGEVLAVGNSGCPPPSPCNPAALRRLRVIKGSMLTDDPNFALLSPRQIHFVDFAILRGMRTKGLYNDRPLIQLIEQHQFAAIALTNELLHRQWQGKQFMWPTLRHAIAANYSLVSPVGPPFLMLPKQSSTPLQRTGRAP